MSQEKTITVLRRMHEDGDWRYQIWPSDLPANAPVPKWQHKDEIPESVVAGVVGALFTGAFGPLPCGFGADVGLQVVWEFIHLHMAQADVERPIVLRDDSGETMGELWDSSRYFAHWENPQKMRAYLDLIGFDQPH